jgi:hypothetical protein
MFVAIKSFILPRPKVTHAKSAFPCDWRYCGSSEMKGFSHFQRIKKHTSLPLQQWPADLIAVLTILN